jgi:parvulin-like peptidyl-prolyl isomerase
MSGPRKRRPGWRWMALLTVVVTAAAGTVYWLRGPGSPLASARPQPQPAPSAAPARLPSLPGVPVDYHERVVAYLGDEKTGAVISRAELGEYLIPRFGPDKLDRLVKRRILERACRAYGVEVTASEVDATLAEHLQGLNVKREEFVKDVLKGYHMNLTEWKEDMIRPRLMLTKLVRPQIQVSEQDLREAFEAMYGELIAVRVIAWPKDEEKAAMDQFARLRDSEEAFAEAARSQKNSAFAAAGGRMKPFRRHILQDKLLEDSAFKLQPGQVSELIHSADGILMIKCDARQPADRTVNFEAKREELLKAATDRRIDEACKQYYATLLKDANPHSLVYDDPALLTNPNAHVLVTIWGNEPITREELGEFLIQRFGAERLEFLVNTRIIERACQARGINVTDADVEAELEKKLKAAQVSQKDFIKTYLNPQGKNLYEFKEDVLREQLRLARLFRDSVQATEEEIQMAYNAYYGEKRKCRIIIYPTDERRIAEKEYESLSNSDNAFSEKAKHQASKTLACREGSLDAFARNTTGDHILEEAAFRLLPGQVSAIIETAQGPAILKLDSIEPPNPNPPPMAQIHDQLQHEVIERKIPIESIAQFKVLRARDNPRLLLQDPNRGENLAESVRESLDRTDTIRRVSSQTTKP